MHDPSSECWKYYTNRPVNVVRDLGVFLGEELTMRQRINKV